jgi:hypothetical protein
MLCFREMDHAVGPGWFVNKAKYHVAGFVEIGKGCLRETLLDNNLISTNLWQRSHQFVKVIVLSVE